MLSLAGSSFFSTLISIDCNYFDSDTQRDIKWAKNAREWDAKFLAIPKLWKQLKNGELKRFVTPASVLWWIIYCIGFIFSVQMAEISKCSECVFCVGPMDMFYVSVPRLAGFLLILSLILSILHYFGESGKIRKFSSWSLCVCVWCDVSAFFSCFVCCPFAYNTTSRAHLFTLKFTSHEFSLSLLLVPS